MPILAAGKQTTLSMIDFRLKVFYTVAKRLNFTKAAAELFISQPAVTKHIKELEENFKVSLFERSGNKKIVLTPAGQIFLNYSEQLLRIYSELDTDIALLNNQHSGVLRIGGSNTVAQYVIPPLLARFNDKFGDIKVNLVTGNTEQIEQALLNQEINIGIVEGIHRNPLLKYDELLKDELVLVCRTAAKLKKDLLKPAELTQLPFITREPGSGTRDVIEHALKQIGIKIADLQTRMQLDGTESIKSYLLNSDCFAFLSVQSILNELRNNALRIVDVKGLTIERLFYLIQIQGQTPPLNEIFTRFVKKEIQNQ